MPEPGRSEQIGFLRHAIARIEAGGKVARTGAKTADPTSGLSCNPEQTHSNMANNLPALSPQPAAFYEIAPVQPGDSGAAAGFTLMLAGQLVHQVRRPLLWIAEDFALSEQGAPYIPGLAAYGIGAADFVLIRVHNRLDLWRVMEEALKARSFSAVVGEPAALAGRDLPAHIRRLAIRARRYHSSAILLRPPAQASFLSPSPLRFHIAAQPSRQQPAPALLSPAVRLPGHPVWHIHYRGAPGKLPTNLPAQLHNLDPEKPLEVQLVAPASSVSENRQPFVRERARAPLSIHMSDAA